MTAVYQTRAGDMVDLIAHEYYAGRRGAFEFVLANNPGLASKGMQLPAGVVIQLPVMPEQTIQNQTDIPLFN